jgi:hypothetical protein
LRQAVLLVLAAYGGICAIDTTLKQAVMLLLAAYTDSCAVSTCIAVSCAVGMCTRAGFAQEHLRNCLCCHYILVYFVSNNRHALMFSPTKSKQYLSLVLEQRHSNSTVQY